MDTALSWIQHQQQLQQLVSERYQHTKGKIVLFAGFEWERYRFRQESSFYYVTGLQEPGAVVVIDCATKQTTLYIPDYAIARAEWMYNPITLTTDLSAHGITDIRYLGAACPGYTVSLVSPLSIYDNLMQLLQAAIQQEEPIFTLVPPVPGLYGEQRVMIERLIAAMPKLLSHVVDISPLVAQLRRKKSAAEIVCLQRAIQVTLRAQKAAAACIADGANEAQVQAVLEGVMLAHQMQPAFTSIVGSGIYSTVLHYHANNHVMRDGDLVVVDIGAVYKNYCADITRTYPVSGKFTARQEQLYMAVLETQYYIAQTARPGYWLNNREFPQKSLNHLARAFLAERGLDQYFLHSIGHYLGLDVHDVGDYSTPLVSGDIITIEPGLYLASERIGIRIEDNYLITESGALCLSAELGSSIDEIEALCCK